jgi:hypothetical protein
VSFDEMVGFGDDQLPDKQVSPFLILVPFLTALVPAAAVCDSPLGDP